MFSYWFSRLHIGGQMARNAPRLSLPGKLVFPSAHNSGHFSMLGLGDIVMPGLLLCFVMRYDAYKRAQVSIGKFISNQIFVYSLINYYDLRHTPAEQKLVFWSEP